MRIPSKTGRKVYSLNCPNKSLVEYLEDYDEKPDDQTKFKMNMFYPDSKSHLQALKEMFYGRKNIKTNKWMTFDATEEKTQGKCQSTQKSPKQKWKMIADFVLEKNKKNEHKSKVRNMLQCPPYKMLRAKVKRKPVRVHSKQRVRQAGQEKEKSEFFKAEIEKYFPRQSTWKLASAAPLKRKRTKKLTDNPVSSKFTPSCIEVLNSSSKTIMDLANKLRSRNSSIESNCSSPKSKSRKHKNAYSYLRKSLKPTKEFKPLLSPEPSLLEANMFKCRLNSVDSEIAETMGGKGRKGRLEKVNVNLTVKICSPFISSKPKELSPVFINPKYIKNYEPVLKKKQTPEVPEGIRRSSISSMPCSK